MVNDVCFLIQLSMECNREELLLTADGEPSEKVSHSAKKKRSREAWAAQRPRSRRLDLLDLFPCDALLALEEAAFFGAAAFACAVLANTPSPAARNSVRARLVAFRTRIMISVWFRSVVGAANYC